MVAAATTRIVAGAWRNMLAAALLVLALAACNTTKFVPDDEYLLNKAKVEITDTKDVPSSDMNSYLRQHQNSEVFGFWKLQLHVYNTAPRDTTSKANKFFARNAHKMGEAPEIYDELLTEASMKQIALAMNNRGYFNAEVDTVKQIKIFSFHQSDLDFEFLFVLHQFQHINRAVGIRTCRIFFKAQSAALIRCTKLLKSHEI